MKSKIIKVNWSPRAIWILKKSVTNRSIFKYFILDIHSGFWGKVLRTARYLQIFHSRHTLWAKFQNSIAFWSIAIIIETVQVSLHCRVVDFFLDSYLWNIRVNNECISIFLRHRASKLEGAIPGKGGLTPQSGSGRGQTGGGFGYIVFLLDV